METGLLLCIIAILTLVICFLTLTLTDIRVKVMTISESVQAIDQRVHVGFSDNGKELRSGVLLDVDDALLDISERLDELNTILDRLRTSEIEELPYSDDVAFPGYCQADADATQVLYEELAKHPESQVELYADGRKVVTYKFNESGDVVREDAT